MSSFNADNVRVKAATLEDVATAIEKLRTFWAWSGSSALNSITVTNTNSQLLTSDVITAEEDDLLLAITTIAVSSNYTSDSWRFFHSFSSGAVLSSSYHSGHYRATTSNSTGEMTTIPIISYGVMSAADNVTVESYVIGEGGSGTLYYRRLSQIVLKLKQGGLI